MRRLALALLCLACGPTPDEETRTLELRGVAVHGDSNGDGRLNPGESAELRVELGGEGVSTLRCAVASETAGVELASTDDELRFYSCSGTCREDFRVKVGPQVAPGTVARFRCDAEDGASLRFEVPIEAAAVSLRVTAVRVDDDANGDGVLNPGESASIEIALRNDGASAVTGTHCVVGALTAGVDVQPTDGELQYFHCKAGADCDTSDFDVRVAPDAAPGTVARFACALVDGQDAAWPIEVSARVEASAARPVFDGFTTEGERPLVPGFRCELRVRLQNVGPSAMTGASCAVTSDAPWLEVQAFDDELRFFHCKADAECGEDGFDVRVADDAPAGGRATLTCPLVDAQQQTWPLTLEVTLAE